MDSTIPYASKKRLPHTAISVFITLVGVALLIYMITVEDEPGAVPLLLIAVGIGWFLIGRFRLKPRHP